MIFFRKKQIKLPEYDKNYKYPFNIEQTKKYNDSLLFINQQDKLKIINDILFINSFIPIVKKEHKTRLTPINECDINFEKPKKKDNYVLGNYHPLTKNGNPSKNTIDIEVKCSMPESTSKQIYVNIFYLKDGSINRLDVQYFYGNRINGFQYQLKIRKNNENKYYVYNFREVPYNYIL